MALWDGVSDVIRGRYGRAERVPLPPEEERAKPDHTATLAVWLITSPHYHPFWSQFLLSSVHLRDIEGVKPAHKLFEEAQYEVLVAALNPEKGHRDAKDGPPFRHMVPLNVREQFAAGTDEQVAHLTGLLAGGVVWGVLNPEPQGIIGAREQWAHSIESTMAHLVTGGLAHGKPDIA